MLVVDLTVEVEVGQAGKAVEGVFVPDFDAVKSHRVVAQFHLEGTQGEVHLQEFFAEGDGAVLSHDALDAGVKERIDFFGFLDGAQGMAPRE